MIFSRPQHPSLRPTGLHLRWRQGLIRFGLLSPWIRFRARLSGGQCQFGKRISLQGKLRIRGPGTVILEDDVIIGDQVDLYTHSAEAVLRIGRGTFLNGTRISCVNRVEIGRLNIIGDARIMDTDFHWSHRERHRDHRPPPSRPVITEDNVWLAAGSALLKGASIGQNSILAFGSVTSAKIPADEIWMGSPAQKKADLPAPPELVASE